jgi:hypothetical protein
MLSRPEVLSWNFPGAKKTTEISATTVSVQSEIQTGHLQNRITQSYHHTKLLGTDTLSIIKPKSVGQVGQVAQSV